MTHNDTLLIIDVPSIRDDIKDLKETLRNIADTFCTSDKEQGDLRYMASQLLESFEDPNLNVGDLKDLLSEYMIISRRWKDVRNKK